MIPGRHPYPVHPVHPVKSRSFVSVTDRLSGSYKATFLPEASRVRSNCWIPAFAAMTKPVSGTTRAMKEAPKIIESRTLHEDEFVAFVLDRCLSAQGRAFTYARLRVPEGVIV